MAIKNFQYAIGPTMVGPRENIFKIRFFRRLENAILRLAVQIW